MSIIKTPRAVRTLAASFLTASILLLGGCASEPPKAPPAATPPPAASPAPAPAASPTPATPTPAPEPPKPAEPAPSGKFDPAKKYLATLETNKGTIEFELLPADAPKTCESFRILADKGYYNNLTFHRVINGFMIQGGDPNGNGTGGESGFGKEFTENVDRTSAVYQAGYLPGIVAMANVLPHTNGSQFFIMHKKYDLPPNYTIFGRVVKGQNVVDAIASVPTGPNDKPLSPVVMKKVSVREEAAK